MMPRWPAEPCPLHISQSVFDEGAFSKVPAKSYWVGQGSVRVVQVAPASVVA